MTVDVLAPAADAAGDPHRRRARLRRRAARALRAAPARAARRPRAARARASPRGETLDFLPETREIREGDWQVAAAAADYCRTAASRSPARPTARWSSTRSTRARKGFMADFEDAQLARRGRNVVEGQVNLIDAIEGTIEYDRRRRHATTSSTTRSRRCSCARAAGTCPRSTCASTASRSRARFVDFGLYFFHNAQRLLEQRRGPVLLPAEDGAPPRGAAVERRLHASPRTRSGSTAGTIRATVLIETLPAAFQMDEILYELREHSCGAQRRPLGLHLLDDQVLPRRPGVRAARPQRREDDRAVHAAPTRELLVKTCHRARRVRDGRHGGADPVAQGPRGQRARDRGGARPTRSARPSAGFDGTWVAHPDVGADGDGGSSTRCSATGPTRSTGSATTSTSAPPSCSTSASTPGRHHRGRACATTSTSASSTSRSWLRGNGAAGINNLMEDAATAEISRSQVWQWIRHGRTLDDGTPITRRARAPAGGRGARAHPRGDRRRRVVRDARAAREESRALFEQVALADELAEFLTIPAYEQLD